MFYSIFLFFLLSELCLLSKQELQTVPSGDKVVVPCRLEMWPYDWTVVKKKKKHSSGSFRWSFVKDVALQNQLSRINAVVCLLCAHILLADCLRPDNDYVHALGLRRKPWQFQLFKRLLCDVFFVRYFINSCNLFSFPCVSLKCLECCTWYAGS